MMPNDDRDIKLFVSSNNKVKTKESGDSDILAVAQALDTERSNGNLAKSKKIGEKLACLKPENVQEILGIKIDSQLPPNILYEIRVLMLFTAQVTLHSVLPQILSTQAVNSMYDYLRINSEAFYDNVIECSSFSLYYLALRNKIDIENDISENFAVLCGKEEDENIVKLGNQIFVETGKYVKRLSAEIKK